MKKTLTALAAAATIAVAVVAAPTTADARHFRHGGAVAAGVIGGLAAGALFSGAFASPYYYGYGPAYAYEPVYAGPACSLRRQWTCGPYGCGWRRVRVCYGY